MTAEHTDDFFTFVRSFEKLAIERDEMNVVEYELVKGKSTRNVVVYRFLICLFFIFRTEFNSAEVATFPDHFLEISSSGHCWFDKHAVSE